MTHSTVSQIGFVSLVLVAMAAAVFSKRAGADGEQEVPLTIEGGHETDPRDRGRPVALVAGALGVSADVFREAFSHVRPAPAGQEPDRAQVQRNKSALLGALAKYGVTNDELDRVSDYYRIPPGRGKLWPVKAAAGHAILKNGRLESIVITDPGSGYNSPPSVTIPGFPDIALTAKLAFGSDLKKNGSLASVSESQPGDEPSFQLGPLLPPDARERLKLTPDQQAEIAQLETEVKERLSKILTAEQRQRLSGGFAPRRNDPSPGAGRPRKTNEK
ncbi:MAG TPA: hypothetical protein VHC22_27600 [Pirellulales bacterium]|nr:hypothetical protein [Pirellulales bacterium]